MNENRCSWGNPSAARVRQDIDRKTASQGLYRGSKLALCLAFRGTGCPGGGIATCAGSGRSNRASYPMLRVFAPSHRESFVYWRSRRIPKCPPYWLLTENEGGKHAARLFDSAHAKRNVIACTAPAVALRRRVSCRRIRGRQRRPRRLSAAGVDPGDRRARRPLHRVFQTGFADQAHLTRVFKRIHGSAPGTLRKAFAQEPAR